MKRIAVLCLASSALLASPDAASADTSLAAAVDAAWQRAVLKLESAGRISSAAAERRVASAWWADTPALELSHRTGDWGNNPGERESEIAIAWPAWIPGQRRAQVQAASAEAELAAIAEQDARLRVAGEVRELAWHLAAVQAEAIGANARTQHLEALANDADRRLNAGELSRSDTLAIHAEWLDAVSTGLQTERALEAARAEWGLLTGTAIVSDPHEAVPAPDAELRLAEHPAVRLVSVNLARARAQLRAARAARIDQPELRVLYREEVAMEGAPLDRSMGVGLRIPLGGARNAPRNAAAESAALVAELAAERELETRRSTAALARTGLVAAERRFEAAEKRIALLRERIALLERAHRARETSLSEILRERHALADAETAHARARAAFGLAKARLRQSLGILP